MVSVTVTREEPNRTRSGAFSAVVGGYHLYQLLIALTSLVLRIA